jgi:hypothetical protein
VWGYGAKQPRPNAGDPVELIQISENTAFFPVRHDGFREREPNPWQPGQFCRGYHICIDAFARFQ